MMSEVGYGKMRLFVLMLIATFFNANADFSVKSIKNWFKDLYNKGSAKVESGVENIKASTAGQQVSSFVDQSKDTFQSYRKGVLSPEFLDARKNLLDYTNKLIKELDADIHSLSQLEDGKYFDRVAIYKEGKNYVEALKKCLSEELDNLSDARKMKESVDMNMGEIISILTDELIFSYIDDLRQAYNTFNTTFEQIENNLKKKK
jgi:hypothetical protein